MVNNFLKAHVEKTDHRISHFQYLLVSQIICSIYCSEIYCVIKIRIFSQYFRTKTHRLKFQNICNFTAWVWTPKEHRCRSVISIKLQSTFTCWLGWSPVNLLFILRTPFPNNTSGWLLLNLSLFKGCLWKNVKIRKLETWKLGHVA